MAWLEAIPYEVLEGILLEAARIDIVSANTIPFVSHLWKRLLSQHPPEQLKWYDMSWTQKEYNIHIAQEAAFRGHFEVLKWLKENGCPFGDACTPAATGGHLEILKWLKNEGGCNFNGRTCASAAKGGPWGSSSCAMAAQEGHFEVLKWLKENGCPCTKDTFSHAAGRGNIEMLKWLKEIGCPWTVKHVLLPHVTDILRC